MLIRRLPNSLRHTHPQAGRDRPEMVVAINRNGRSRSIGMGGRDQSERVVAINRYRWSRSSGARIFEWITASWLCSIVRHVSVVSKI